MPLSLIRKMFQLAESYLYVTARIILICNYVFSPDPLQISDTVLHKVTAVSAILTHNT